MIANLLASNLTLPVAIVVILVTCAAWLLMYVQLVARQRHCRSTPEPLRTREVTRTLESQKRDDLALPDQKQQELATELLAAEMSGFRRLTPLLALSLATVAGLGILSGRLSQQSPVAALDSQTVFVADGAGQTVKVDLPAGNATLLTALNRANTPPSNEMRNPDKESQEPRLVAVRRPEETTRVYYFPLSLVRNGLPGNMPLLAEDTIRVVELAETTLGVLDSTQAGVPFEVRGLIERPGSYTTQEMSEFVANVSTPQYGGSFSTDRDGPDVIIVTRSPSGTGLVETYFVPIVEPYIDPYLLQSRIQRGDILEYARLADLDLLRTANSSP